MIPDDGVDRPAPDGRVHLLAGGTELLGEYRDSAFQEPKYLIQRADGQVMQLPGLLYRVACSLDGRGDEQIADDLNAELGQDLTAEQVRFLVEERLLPVGIVVPHQPPADDACGAAAPAVPVRADPLLALRYRVGVVPAAVVGRIAGVLRPLFVRPVWVALLTAFVGVDAWVVVQGHGLGRLVAGVEQMVRQPGLVLAVLALTLASAAFHECGHVAACRYGGARPGDIGVGLYIIWPAFYSNVTDSYRLDRVGRLRTDLGGVYFNALFMLGLGLVYVRTGEPWLLVALVLMHAETAWQFLPSIRLDGYYILADLVGVPDLFGYVRPVLLSLVPGRPAEPKVGELKPRARRVVVLWVVVVVPLLLFWLVAFLLALPVLLPAAWRASREYLQGLGATARSGDVAATALGVFQLFMLVLPWIGAGLMLWSVIVLLARRLPLVDRARMTAVRRARVRRGAAVTALWAAGIALVARVAAVAGSRPATSAEVRLTESSFAELHGQAGPSVVPDGLLVREQLVLYSRLAGVFDHHPTALGAGRELAVLATAVLVFTLVALVHVRRLPPTAATAPLVAALAMGPVVGTLTTAGSGVVGAAWVAVGTFTLSQVGGRAAALVGVLALGAGVATEPLVAVPPVVAVAVVLVQRLRRDLGSQGRPLAPPGAGTQDAARWVAAACVLPLAGLGAVLARAGDGLQLDSPERVVLLLDAGVVTIAGLVAPRLRAPAAAAGSAVLLAALPWSGVAAALPMVVAGTVLLGTFMGAVVLSRSAADRPHPLLRAAVALPVLVLTGVGAMLPPASDVVAVPAALTTPGPGAEAPPWMPASGVTADGIRSSVATPLRDDPLAHGAGRTGGRAGSGWGVQLRI